MNFSAVVCWGFIVLKPHCLLRRCGKVWQYLLQKGQVVTPDWMKRYHVRVDEKITYITSQNIYRKSSLCWMTSYCLRVILRPPMGVMCVENSFLLSLVKDASLVNNTLAGKKGSFAHFSKYLWEKQYDVHNHPVKVHGHAAHETDACCVLGELCRR